MNQEKFRKLIRTIIKEVITEADNKSENRESDGAKQVKAFLNSLEKSSLAKKLKTIDTSKEKLEILVKFADMIDFPKEKISKLSSELKK
jgi:hypothetical protein